jgi:1,4-dihydroxy-2-naphthoate octaprenyltransferase
MASRAPQKKNASRGASAQQWIEGARLRTLPLAVAPVAIGSGAAATMHGFNAPLALLCLVVALALQVGVNYSNDYSDGVRGTDDFRVGPPRLTGSGAANPKRVLAVAVAFFAVAGLAGLVIVLVTAQWWMIAVGAAAIIAAWFYTGGKNPYGYAGWGEVFVFIFFGLVATLGTTYVQAGFVNDQAWLGAVGTGMISCAVLVVNNIRDIATDTQAGKKTLSVRIGKTASIVLFCILLLVPFGIAALIAVFYPVAWLVQLGLLLALPACLIAATGKTPKEYVLALKLSSFAGLVFGLGIAVAYFYAS